MKDMLSNKELEALLTPEEPMLVIIKSHQLLESSLILAISESLPVRHQLELSRLSFPLKVDLAIALKMVALDSKPLWVFFNKLRNDFAHKSEANLTPSVESKLRSALSARHAPVFDKVARSLRLPLGYIKAVVIILFTELRHSFDCLREQQMANEVMNEMITETAASLKKLNLPTGETDAEFKKRIELKRQTRKTHS
jgi:hypothetical protein